MKLNNERKGEFLIILMALLWGLFPVITALSLNTISPLISLGWSTLFAAVFFGLVILLRKKTYELRKKSAYYDLIMTSLLMGVVMYLFYFFGLRTTSAGNASLIALSEVFFSFLLFNIFKKEYISGVHLAGAALILTGAAIVLYPNMTDFRNGDLLIMGAAFTAPFGNYYVKKAREKVSSETIMFVRSSVSAIVVFALIFILGTDFTMAEIKTSLLFLAVNGVLLLGLSKMLWIEAAHRISVTKAVAISSISPLITMLTAWMFMKDAPTGFQLLSFLPMFFGVILLSRNKKPTFKYPEIVNIPVK